MQSDGKIVVTGSSEVGTVVNLALVRYLGTTYPSITVEHPAGTYLADGSASIAFGSGNIGGAPLVRTFTVRNIGTAILTGLAVSTDGPHASDFTVGPLGATTLAAGASTTVPVSFSPVAAGARTAAIHIANNDADRNPFDISVTGTGTGPLQAWRLLHFGNPDNSGDGANSNDFDRDGLNNLLEYAFGGDPKARDAAAIIPTPSVLGGQFAISFKCDAGHPDITYTVQASSGLVPGSWVDIAKSVGGATVLPIGLLGSVSDTGVGSRTVMVTASPTLFPADHGFLRLQVSN